MIHKESGVDNSIRGKISRMITYAFFAIIFTTIVSLTWKSYTLSVKFQEYRKTHPHTEEECVAKNHSVASSDSGTGLIPPPVWRMKNYTGIDNECVDSWCISPSIPN